MKILVYGINYSPEVTGIGKYTGDLCEWLAVQGHEVEVITAMPYYPQWTVDADYRGKGWYTESMNGVKVKRCPLYVPKEVTGLTRIIHELSFFLSSLFFWIQAFFTRYDTVVCIYPPLCIGLLPVIYKWIYACSLIFHIQDLQVDAARELKLIKSEGVLSAFEQIEKFYFKHSTVVSTISHGMMKRVEEKGVPINKIQLFANWVDTEALQPLLGQKAQIKAKYKYLPEDEVVLYAGNMGEKQGLESIIEIAEVLQQRGDSRVKFHIVGDGNAKKKLMQMAAESKLNNIRFAPLVPKEELCNLLNMADLHLVLQKKGVKDLVMPSKLTNILSCGGVTLVAAEKGSNLRQLVESYHFGVTAEAEDSESILQAIENFFASPRNGYAKQARSYATLYLNKENILQAFEKQLIHNATSNVLLGKRSAKLSGSANKVA